MEEQNTSGGVLNWFNSHPTIALALAIFGALAIGGLVLRSKSSTAAGAGGSAAAPTGDTSGLQTDASGHLIVYKDVADSFYNFSDVSGSYNTTNNTTTTTTTTYNPPPPPPVFHPGPVPGPVPTPAPKPPTPAPKPPTSNKGQWVCTHQVARGETLSGIAASYGTDWHTLYSHNQHTIDATAAGHGSPIPGGPWNNIFGGEVLTVPCK